MDMQPFNKRILSALIPAALLAAGSGSALAQGTADYPSKPVVVVVPTEGTGIGEDVRFFIQSIERTYPGTSYVIERRAGAASTMGAAYVARAKPDGYTLLAPNTALTIGPAVYPDLTYDVTKDFTPISLLMQKAYLLVVHNSLPFKTVKEYLGYTRYNPGDLNFATSGNGSSTHLPAALLHHMTKTKVTFIHYKRSADRVTDTVGGRTGALVGTYATLLPHFKSGRLRPLAVTTNKRVSSVPDLPTIAETVPGFEYSSWTGMLAPGKMSPELQAKVNKIWTDSLKDPVVSKKLQSDGTIIVGSTPQEFQKFITADAARWKSLIKATGIKVEDD
jgi:tripartite-type tricarboxylate transporter receptor subunit TctC